MKKVNAFIPEDLTGRAQKNVQKILDVIVCLVSEN